MTGEDRDLGMGGAITRRDFVNGVSAAGLALGLAGRASAGIASPPPGLETDASGTYPPLRNGMRGMHPGSFEGAHALRDGQIPPTPVSTGETYDLVVVGGGLSGLASAWYYRQAAGPNVRILILDNHDDFGGHARRNEFVYNGQKRVITGGSGYMSTPGTWPRAAIGLIDAMGIDWREGAGHPAPNAAQRLGLKRGTFFRSEIYGKDTLVRDGDILAPTPEFMARTPLSPHMQAEVLRLFHGRTDYLAGMTVEQKIAKLQSISYRDYLLDVAKFSPEILPYTFGVWCLGNDMADAWFAHFRRRPGFDGLGLPMPGGSPESAEAEARDFYLPAGNSDIARLIVRSLIPETLPAGSWQQIETARVNYGMLDREGAPTRLRLNSIVVRARHIGPSPMPYDAENREVEVAYVSKGKAWSVRGKDVIMAGMNNMVPYICPEMPDQQKIALHTAVRAPNQSTNVLFRNWESFAGLGLNGVTHPASFYGLMRPNFAKEVGDLKQAHDPSEPIVVAFSTSLNSGIANNPTMVSTLIGADMTPGTDMDNQFRMIRGGLLQTPFETFEREMRSQATRALAGSRFDPARDILAVTVNRWPHGFATGRNVLFDKIDPASDLSPPLIARQKFGRIAIANSDAAGIGMVQTALDEAARAVRDLQPRDYGYFETF